MLRTIAAPARPDMTNAVGSPGGSEFHTADGNVATGAATTSLSLPRSWLGAGVASVRIVDERAFVRVIAEIAPGALLVLRISPRRYALAVKCPTSGEPYVLGIDAHRPLPFASIKAVVLKAASFGVSRLEFHLEPPSQS